MGDGVEYRRARTEVARCIRAGFFRAPRKRSVVFAGSAIALSAFLSTVTLDAAFSSDLGLQPANPSAPPAGSIDSGWVATLKATGESLPDWEGAKSHSFLSYPSISLRRSDAREWSAPDDGLDFSVYDASGFSIGPVARYELGRYRNDDPRRLFGIHDVSWTIEPGIFAEFWAIPDMFRTRLEIRHGLDTRNGFVADAAADYVLRFGAATFAVGPRLSFGDRDFMRRQFGVNLTDSLQNGAVSPFRPDGGPKSAGVATSLTYDFSKQWSAVIYGGYDRLVDDAAKSPLVRKLGSADQFQAGLTLSYSFSLHGL